MNVDRQVLFLLTVVLFGILFSLGPFGLSVGFFVTISIIAAFLLGILGVYVFGGNMRLHTNLPFIGYVLTLATAFIYVPSSHLSASSYGIPAQWIFIQPISGRTSVDMLALALNVFCFYVLLRLGRGLYRNVKQSPGQKRQAET
ncbi:hypothetical protein [Alkalicoccus luteus]|uniref:Uncharacterized protein n=1 Tax=Alkalicoccus luteus TaxID=1237094 RepID=A0A969PYN4_9BACI|nr:hypothetical protein [Alkalicoccus luteus]NJP37967.1 hypothetical protein [Alkalicoccus luteus]